MGVSYLRSKSCILNNTEEKTGNLSKIKTLKRSVSKTLRSSNKPKEVTKECTNEFQFIKFDAIDEAFDGDLSDKKNDRNVKSVENAEEDSQTLKGILWQQSGNIFSSWQERFFVLTGKSLYSFPQRGPLKNNLRHCKKFGSKVALSDIIEVNLVERKGQLVIEIVTKNGKTCLRKPEGVREWFEKIVENNEDVRKNLLERKLIRSKSLVLERNSHQGTVISTRRHHVDMSICHKKEDTLISFQSQQEEKLLTSNQEDTVSSLKSEKENSVISLKGPTARPFMGCKSLIYATQKQEQNCNFVNT